MAVEGKRGKKKRDTGKAERRSKERQLKIENQKLKEQLKTGTKEAEERAIRDAETIRNDTETLRANIQTMQELKTTVEEYEKKMRIRDQEIASLQEASGGPQEETWRRLVRESETQTLQKENNYVFTPGRGGMLQHPLHERLRQDLGHWHPKETDLNLEWTFTGKWVPIPKEQFDSNKIYYNY